MGEVVFTTIAKLPTGPVSVEPYRSPAYYALEQERVFRRAWLYIGRVEELPKVHDYILRPVEVCKAQVLLTHAEDNKIRAFHNVCSHRGNQIAILPQGNQRVLACRYHNWCYKHNGELMGVPDEESFFQLDKTALGLTPIHCEVWNGFIFINFDKSPTVTLKQFLGGAGEALDGIEYINTETPLVFQALLKCNWKVAADAFSEAYHVKAIHPKTIGPTYASKENPFGHPNMIRFYGPHNSSSMWGNPNYKTADTDLVEKLSTAHMSAGTVLSAAGLEQTRRFLAHTGVNPDRSVYWANDINVIFPNFHIDTSPGGFWTHHFWPTSYNTTRWESRWYLPPAATVRERFQQEHYAARLGEILLEDLSNVERAQQGLESGAKDFMVLQDCEAPLRNLLFHLDKWINAKSAAEALDLA